MKMNRSMFFFDQMPWFQYKIKISWFDINLVYDYIIFTKQLLNLNNFKKIH